MTVDVAIIEAEASSQFRSIGDRLTRATMPTTALECERLGLDADDPNQMRAYVRACLDLTATRASAATQANPAILNSIIGVKAFLLLDSGPNPSEFTEICKANSSVRNLLVESQAARFSWARWQQRRALQNGHQERRAPNERAGRNRLGELVRTLAICLTEGAQNPQELQIEVPGPEDRGQQVRLSGVALEIEAASADYMDELAVDAQLHVPRSMEDEVFEGLRDAHKWPRVIVGEAGNGKSTLLWHIASRLQNDPKARAILLPATWLLEPDRQSRVELLVNGLRDINAAYEHHDLILMLDTVDLLLHDSLSQQLLIRALQAVRRAGFSVICATRPHEAALLRISELREHVLNPYDDEEIDNAVASLAFHYCKGIPGDQIIADVRSATARGLPAAEVCRSPLLLRLLFELSSPAAPELRDIDTTQLLRSYWQRRVVRDARSDRETRFRTTASANHAGTAEVAALSLLSAGLPELPASALRDAAATVGELSAGELDEGLETLTERGVLTVTGNRKGFFHQTMFEFAAATAILTRSPVNGIAALTERTCEHDGDLFVGSVLEQALVLAADTPTYSARLAASVTRVTESASEAIQGIGLVAWGHYPALLPSIRQTLSVSGESPIIRAVRHIPAIASKPVGESISQLLVVWERRSEPSIRAAVLRSLARISLRDPAAVTEALEYLKLDEVGPTRADADALHTPLLDVLDGISTFSASTARRHLVAILINADARQSVAIDYFTERWSVIGTSDLLDEIWRIVDDLPTTDHNVAFAFGRLLYQQWIFVNSSLKISDKSIQLTQLAGRPERSFRASDEAELIAIGQLLLLSSGHAAITNALTVLLELESDTGRTITSTQIFPMIANSVSDSRACLAELTKAIMHRVLVNAARNAMSIGEQTILNFLVQTQLSNDFIIQTVPRRYALRDWLLHPELTRLLPVAADAGSQPALRALEVFGSQVTTRSRDEAQALLSSIPSKSPRTDEVFNTLLQVALDKDLFAEARALLLGATTSPGRVATQSEFVVDKARKLLQGGSPTDRETGALLLASLLSVTSHAVAWPELRDAMNRTQGTRAHVSLIQVLWRFTTPELASGVIDYLSTLINVRPDEVPPIRRRDGVNIEVATAAVMAYQRILVLRMDVASVEWPSLITVSCYELENEKMFVVGTKFAVIMSGVARLCEVSPQLAATRLLEFLNLIANADFFGIETLLWRRECIEAIRGCIAGNPVEVGVSLIETCASLDDELATVIVDAVAMDAYETVRSSLVQLGQAASGMLRDHVIDTIRTYDRRQGSLAYPEIVAILHQRSDVPPGVLQPTDADARVKLALAAMREAATSAYRTLLARGHKSAVLAARFGISESAFKRLGGAKSWAVPSYELCKMVDHFGRTQGLEFELVRRLNALRDAEMLRKDSNSWLQRQQ